MKKSPRAPGLMVVILEDELYHRLNNDRSFVLVVPLTTAPNLENRRNGVGLRFNGVREYPVRMKAIVAMTRNRVIGKKNKIPWYLPGEQKWFKETTMGHPVLMGRKTFESIGHPLPGRHNIVVTRSGEIEGVEIVRDLAEFNPALYEANGRDLFVIGGSDIYRALLPKCDAIYVTMVKQEYEGDTYFPAFESCFEVCEVIRETPLYDVLLYRRTGGR